MPGLVGIVSSDPNQRQLLDRMLSVLKHEAFYRTDLYQGDQLAVARLELGIFQRPGQPASNENKTITLWFEGRIYDYQPDLTELKKRGHRFSQETEADYCLHAFEEYGTDFLRRLNGTFLIFIYDFRQQTAWLANDRFNLRQVFYALRPSGLFFAPEPKALRLAGSNRLNEKALAEFLAYGETWSGPTLLEGIDSLPPGSVLTYQSGQVNIRPYWRWDKIPDESLSDDQWVEQLCPTFRRAVRLRLADGLRYGLSLSGGLDSRAILAAVEPAQRRQFLAYSFGQSDCDEVKIARQVTKITGLRHLFLEITPELIVEEAKRSVWLNDGRNHLGQSFAYPLLRQIRPEVDVVFDGYALDAFLGGSYLSPLVLSGKPEAIYQDFSRRRLFRDEELAGLFRPGLWPRLKDGPRQSWQRIYDQLAAVPSFSRFDELFRLTRLAWFPVGYISARCLFETAHPTADNKLIELLSRIPPAKKIGHYLYRKFLNKLSPELARLPYNKTMVSASAPLWFWRTGAIYQNRLARVKSWLGQISHGMISLPDRRSYVHFRDWLRFEPTWRDFFWPLLLDKASRSREYFDQSFIQGLLELHLSGQKNNALKILYLATLELFLQQFDPARSDQCDH